MIRSALISAAIALTPVLALAAESTPAAFGATFCKASLDDDMAPVEAAFTPGLATIVAEAKAKNDEIEAAAPDEKPPLGDGFPWRSWTDYANGCEIGTVTEADGKALVDILYSFTEAPEANYTDQLVLVGAPDSWLLDDINFTNEMTMRSSLAAAFAF